MMGTELLSSEVDLELQNEDEKHDDDQRLKDLEQEIECPRCYDIMTCDLLLVMK